MVLRICYQWSMANNRARQIYGDIDMDLCKGTTCDLRCCVADTEEDADDAALYAADRCNEYEAQS